MKKGELTIFIKVSLTISVYNDNVFELSLSQYYTAQKQLKIVNSSNLDNKNSDSHQSLKRFLSD